jgi:hypothetical protein
VQYETDCDNPCDSYQTKTESTVGLDKTAFLKTFIFVPSLHTYKNEVKFITKYEIQVLIDCSFQRMTSTLHHHQAVSFDSYSKCSLLFMVMRIEKVCNAEWCQIHIRESNNCRIHIHVQNAE